MTAIDDAIAILAAERDACAARVEEGRRMLAALTAAYRRADLAIAALEGRMEPSGPKRGRVAESAVWAPGLSRRASIRAAVLDEWLTTPEIAVRTQQTARFVASAVSSLVASGELERRRRDGTASHEFHLAGGER